MGSVDPSFAWNSTETSGHDSDVLLNHPSNFQVIWCTHIQDMKESVFLYWPLPVRTLHWAQSIGASSHPRQIVCWPRVELCDVLTLVTTILQLPWHFSPAFLWHIDLTLSKF
jgi:hypothetical protein